MKTTSKSALWWRRLASTAALIGLSLCASAKDRVNPDLPPRNPYLADSSLPVFHADSSQTNASLIPGPRSKTRRIAEGDVLWKKIGPGDGYAIQYSSVYPNGQRVGWFGGAQQLVKLDADTLETLSTYVLNRGKFWSPEEIERLFRKADKLQGQPLFDTLGPPLADGIERGVQAVYRLLDRDNNFFVLNTDRASGDQYIRKYGDAIDGDPNSDIIQKAEFKLPREVGEQFTAIAMNITYDGWLIVATRQGDMFAVSRDFKQHSRIRLRDNESEDKGVMNSFVRNGIAIDEQGGVYVVTRTHLQRLQWTGTELSAAEGDGAWSMPYLSGERGSGTTPILVGWHAGQDKLVVIGDGEHSVMAFWRDRIPDDWQGIKGYSRRVAAVSPMYFGSDPSQHTTLENAMVALGYGIFVANDTPDKKMNWQGSYIKTIVAERYAGQTEGTAAAGGIKWEWNPKTRMLETQWTTPLALVSSICTPNVNGLLYCVGLRNGESTIEALDWKTGKSVFHYLLGKSYRYTVMGGLLDIAPTGEVECGCAGGYGIFRVRENAKRP